MSRRLHSCERCAAASASARSSRAQGQRRGVVLGDVQRERLAQADRHRVNLGQLALGRCADRRARSGRPRATPSPRPADRSRPAPRARSRASDSISSVCSQIARRARDQYERISTVARPSRSSSRRAIAIAASRARPRSPGSHRRTRGARPSPASSMTRSSESPSPSASDASSSSSAAPSSVIRRTPAGLLEADRRRASSSASPSRARSAPRRGTPPSRRPSGRRESGRVPSSSCVSARRRGIVDAEFQRRREQGGGLVEVQRPERRTTGQQRVLDRALAARPAAQPRRSGARARPGRGSRPVRCACSSASATCRCSSARRRPGMRS